MKSVIRVVLATAAVAISAPAALGQGYCQGNVSVTIQPADNSTPTGSQQPALYFHSHPTWDGYIGQGNFPGSKSVDWFDFTFASTEWQVRAATDYLDSAWTAGGECHESPPGSGQCSCSGFANIGMYSKWGAFVGDIIKMPSRTKAITTFYYTDLDNGSNYVGSTDAQGHYDPRPVGSPNNWGGFRVYGDGSAKGESSPHVFFTPGDDRAYDQTKPLKTKSNEVTTFKLKAKDTFLNKPWVPPNIHGTAPPTQRPPAPPAQGPCDNAGQPVNVQTGNVFFKHLDAVVPGIGTTLALARDYNSIQAKLAQGGIFGRGWHTPFDMAIDEPVAGVIRVTDDRGVPTYYEDSDGDLTYRGSMPFSERSTVVKSGSGYVRHLYYGGRESYDTTGRLLQVTDLAGRTTTYARDANGVLLSVTEPGGRSLTFTRNASGLVSAVSGPSGVLATYQYENSVLSSVSYPDGGGFRYVTDSLGLMLTVLDGENRVVEKHEYDASGRGLTSEVDSGVEKLTFSYTYGQTTVTDALGNVTTYDYENVEGIQLVTKITGPCGCGGGSEVQEWTYDEKGRVKTHKDGAGHVTTYDYDPTTGDLVTVTNALSQATTFTFDSLGRVLTQTDPGGHVMTYVYSNAGPTSITETLTSTQNRTTSIAYNALGLPETLTDARGKATTLGYNGSGQLTTVTDPLGHETLFGYDAMGRISLVTDALTHATATSYDARGRVTRITNHDGTYSTFTYDKSGRRTQARDALGKVTYSIYDPLGRLARVVDPMNGATRYEYDVMSRLVALTDAKQQRTAFEYFPNGRLKKTTYPGGAFESSTYDAAGRLATKTDGKLVTTSYSYDALNRLEGVTYSDGVTPAVSYTYHPAGQVATAANGTDTLTWTYDLAGRLLTEQSSKNASTVAYTHDAGSNRLTASLDGALFVSHGYDDASRLTTITRGSNVVGFGYDNANRRTSMTHPNGVNTSYSYDNLNRLLNLSAVHTPTSTTITNFTYTYDAAGNRVTKQQPDHVESYGYDGLYRLTRAERTGGLTGLGTYTYDTVGNRLGAQQDSTVTSSTYNSENQLVSQSGGGSILWRGSLDEPGTVSFTSALVSKPAGMLPGNVFEALLPMSTGSTTVTLQAKDTSNNAMTKQYSVEVTGDAASYRYDPNGNLCSVGGADCSSGSRRYEWSARNELVRVLDNGIETARFKYDTLGRRVEKVAGNITTTWAYAGADILRETISDGTTTTYRYVHGPGIDEPLAREDASTGALQYYHADGLGSIVKVTDQAGAMTLTRRYDAWGNVEIGAGLPGYAFTGREWDPETSLYYYRARHYDPKAGRFISQDPIRFAGGLNLYGYVENDPVALVDPIGLWGFGFTGTVSGEAGLGSGVAGQAGFGGGVFGRGFKELGFGAFTTDGWWAGTPTGPGVGSPSAQAAGVYGASVSAGGAFFGTNANSVCDLKGPFHTGNLTIGLGPISLGLQVSIGTNDAGETILALSAGPPGSGGSKGLSWSWYQTNTTVRGKW